MISREQIAIRSTGVDRSVTDIDDHTLFDFLQGVSGKRTRRNLMSCNVIEKLGSG